MDAEFAYRMAAAAFENATLLAADAEVLAKHKSFGRATALAILGLEECGKARMYAQVMTGLWRGTDNELRERLKGHHYKQLVGMIPRQAMLELLSELPQEEMEEALLSFYEHLQRTPPQDDLTEARTDLEKRLEKIFEPHKARLEEAGRRVRVGYKEIYKQVREESALQNEKHNGLYVDGNESLRVVSTPSDISQEQYLSKRQVLRELLDETGQYLKACGTANEVAELRKLLGRV